MEYKISRSDEHIAHHGIKGQKWGIRRYQNDDGTYTTEGLSRAKRGKIYSKEYDRFKNEEYDRLTRESKKYKKASDEVSRLSKKYGIGEDGSKLESYEEDGSYRGYSSEDRDRARQRIWENKEDMSALSDKFKDEAAKVAGKRLTERYGDTAISDMNYRNNRVAIAWAVPILAANLAFVIPKVLNNGKKA